MSADNFARGVMLSYTHLFNYSFGIRADNSPRYQSWHWSPSFTTCAYHEAQENMMFREILGLSFIIEQKQPLSSFFCKLESNKQVGWNWKVNSSWYIYFARYVLIICLKWKKCSALVTRKNALPKELSGWRLRSGGDSARSKSSMNETNGLTEPQTTTLL